MGKKRRLRANNPKFSKKHSTHPKMLINAEPPKLIHTVEVEPKKEEPKVEIKAAIQLKPDTQEIAEIKPVVEKPKPKTTKKRRTTSTKAKTTTRRPRAKKTATKSE